MVLNAILYYLCCTYIDWFMVVHPGDVGFRFTNNNRGKLGLLPLTRTDVVKLTQEFRQHFPVEFILDNGQPGSTDGLAKSVARKSSNSLVAYI